MLRRLNRDKEKEYVHEFAHLFISGDWQHKENELLNPTAWGEHHLIGILSKNV